MNSVTTCLECGAEISPDAKGLCPKCLLKLGLASKLSPGFIETGVQPPPFLGFDPNDAARRLAVEPFEFGGYRIVRLLGKGGMGAVYEAEDLASGRRVALKVLGHSLDSPDTRKRFLREGRLAASINHPNSVYVYGTEEIEGAPVITMELVPGGTLHDRVKANGPLPVTEAVDAILQIIAGLEAAHAVGILHRDIKPSNCFIDPSGTVKVGDFGLSISTLSRGDSALTIAGSILGTPEFASPEQLRGEELNVRSDIYSVGMTLYYLLTGKTPFHADNVVQLLATVLEKPAPSPRIFRPEIPESLARIVLRCLAKQTGDRFASYDELRRMLLPFNSTAPTPATLGLRFVAGLIDHASITALNMMISQIVAPTLFAYSYSATFHQSQLLWLAIGVIVFEIAYFAIPEGLWGASAGKALVGLRVARLNRSPPGIPKALCRATIYFIPTLVGFLRFLGNDDTSQLTTATSVLAVGSVLCTIVLFSTMRRRNGFAGIHDLLTRTRVIQKAAYEPRPAGRQTEEPVAATEALPKLGPYHVLATLAANAEDALVLGYDTKLLRRVWIRKLPNGTSPVPIALRTIARPGRLRWLQGHRTGDEAWDAYEAMPGAPLLNMLRAPQSWKSLRYWLLDLGEELNASARGSSLPQMLALDRIWISVNGRAKLLDFPAPGADRAACPLEPLETSDPEAVPVFLNQVAISALEGHAASADEARRRAPAVPLPLPARKFLNELRATPDFAATLERLNSLVHGTPSVSRRRRLGLIAGCIMPGVFFAAFTSVGVGFINQWLKLATCLAQYAEYRDGIGATVQAQPKTPKTGPTAQPGPQNSLRGKRVRIIGGTPVVAPNPQAARSMEIYISGHFGDFIRDPRKWKFFTQSMPAKSRIDAEKIVAAHPRPTAAEMRAAHADLAPLFDERGNLKAFEERRGTVPLHTQIERVPYFLGSGMVVGAALLSLFCALAFRGGLLMRLFGIGVVRADGSDASRLRMLWRSVVAWSPVLFGGLALWMLTPLISVPTAMSIVAIFAAGLVIWSAALPGRSLQDRVAGTWLVPR